MNKWDNRFLDMAKLVSTWSKDPSTQVGAVIVDPNKRIVSVGFNGFPQQMPDHAALYDDREEKYSRIIHAEMNALMFANNNVKGCTLYTWPMISCDRCFVHMVQAGIDRFVAPQAAPERLSRWGDAFERVRKYGKEVGVEVVELSSEHTIG